jgi:hypothetical protein
MTFSAPRYAPPPPTPAWSASPDRTPADADSDVGYALHTWVDYAPGGSTRRPDPADPAAKFAYRSTQHRWHRRRQRRALQAALDRADGEEVHRSTALAIVDAHAASASDARRRRTAPRPKSAPRVVCSHGSEPTAVGTHTSSWYEPLMAKPSPGPAANAEREEPGQRWPSARGKQRYWAPGVFVPVSATDRAGAMDASECAGVNRTAQRRNRVRRHTRTGRGSPPPLNELGPSPGSPPARMVFTSSTPAAISSARARLSDVKIPATPQPMQAATRAAGGTPGRSSPPVETPDSPPEGAELLLHAGGGK